VNHHGNGPQAVIAGIGASRQGKFPGSTDLSLATEAVRALIDDCGIDKDAIDGLLTMPGTTSNDSAKHYLELGEHLGINPKVAGSLQMGGATCGALVQQAALYIEAGMAEAVLCVFGDAAKTVARGSRLRLVATRRGRTGECSATPRTARWVPRAIWLSTARPANNWAG